MLDLSLLCVWPEEPKGQLGPGCPSSSEMTAGQGLGPGPEGATS